ncbi:winged helix-turn-helix transcriptional regulator [Holdemanella sp.]|uniref:winged helix-turn-helix transcriptional regulator n=1 Tax=Holdemanella sp. TaxID=1971762 RepID=UPI003AF0C58D
MPNLNYGGTQDDTVNDTVNDIVKNEIMSLMKNNPRITITDIAKALNISRPTATRKIKEVKIDNYIYRIGSDKKGSWIVNER